MYLNNKIPFIMMAMLIMIVSCEKDMMLESPLMSDDYSISIMKSVDMDAPIILYAGQNLPVGEVKIEKDGDNIIIKYVIEHPDWCLMETHLHVATSAAAIPQKNGNPIPGQFEFMGEHDCEKEYSYTLNLKDRGWECGDILAIAAHAVVKSTLCEQTGVVYGMARNTGDVWGIDVVNGSAWVEFESIVPPTGSATPNGLAYDGVNQRMYYCNYRTAQVPRDLYFWDYTSSTEVFAGNLGVENAAADFYNGKYYYVNSYPATDDLYEVTFNSDGTILSNQKIDDMSGDVHKWTFSGDIAINNGILYGWGSCAIDGQYEFFTYNLNTGDFTVNQTAYQGFSMQLAFGTNGILYGHESKDPGNFYMIDLSNGDLSAAIGITPGTLYTDCSSGLLCEPEEETAWGGELEFDGKNWAAYFLYEIECCDAWIVYGSNLNSGSDEFDDAIYAIDLKNQTPRTLVYDPTPVDGSQNYPNGNAYDPDNKRIYFGTDDGRLFYHQIESGTHIQVASDFGVMACAAWYNGKYYYVQNGTNRLYEVSIDASDVATRTQIGTVPTSNGYGDIVFDPENPGVFIGSAGSTAVWYLYDINSNTGTILSRTGGIAKHLQLAYASNGQLYGVESLSGQFYEIEYDATTVTLTEYWNSGFPFTDLASGPQCDY